VPTPSELLRRFRLMAVPGPAAIAAVPVDRSEALRMELEPVFAALRDVNEDVAATVADAEAEGQARRTRAAEEASEIVATARNTTRDARAEAAAVLLAGAADERRDLLNDGRRRATAISDNAEHGIQPAVDELVRRVLAIGTAAAPAS
jgi:vacuolar-type H+-ATPase subunit H